jgi:hypothetical protein
MSRYIDSEFKKTISGSVFSAYPKFEELQAIINSGFESLIDSISNNNNSVIVLLDLHSVFSPLFSDHNKDLFENKSNKKALAINIAAAVINGIGYYRQFFKKYYNASTEIYAYYNISTESEHVAKLVKDIKDPWKNELLDILRNALKIINILVSYIPGIYLIDTKLYMREYFISYVIKELKDQTIVVVSRSDVAYKSVLMSDNVFVIRPSSSKTRIIDRSNLLDCVVLENKQTTDLIPEFYNVILAMKGVDEYESEKIDRLGLKSAYNFIGKKIIVDPITFSNPIAFANKYLLDESKINIVTNNFIKFLNLNDIPMPILFDELIKIQCPDKDTDIDTFILHNKSIFNETLNVQTLFNI